MEQERDELALQFDDRDLASQLLDSLDYDAQLRAIHALLGRHRRAAEELSESINELDDFARRTSGLVNQRAVDDWVDHLHDSVFQDAAHSMAAVGMLAPFVEALFKQAFPGIKLLLDQRCLTPSPHSRWSMKTDVRWDCRFTSPRRRDLVLGIVELADATGLSAELPARLPATLSALFGYRNKMFHFGFEWPESERQSFARRILDVGWPADWFGRATTGGEPWVFYLSPAFVDHCLETINAVIVGLGAFVRRTSRARALNNK
ncbi:MAG: hypothetical protein V4477_24620 [Pseudomonadota bacterium]